MTNEYQELFRRIFGRFTLVILSMDNYFVLIIIYLKLYTLKKSTRYFYENNNVISFLILWKLFLIFQTIFFIFIADTLF